ncbi:hypothetical protein DKT77_08885 [Meridianimarinicoccus roseus]|uniref:DUF2793 domain-containing protein n=1 Tax=Meridianimarinicoccus roseus TaxID=2072018 RepID=A0A2V2LGI5_9RHOB|nr:DUF2793 domain-containing protein [Meridianimarinicoccus roseus]PWR03041.1 hypothetical protein DKT77_08885 [Meridianimarinicoccus roseus]
MTRTANIDLPLVQAAQAQKHVTVNEAFALLDAAAQLVLASVTQTVPPAEAADGTVFHVPPGAVDAWVGQAGRVAVFSNGGWVFVAPRAGWRGWISDTGTTALFDGAVWQPQAVAVSAHGAASLMEVIEADIDLQSGPELTSPDLIPVGCVVLGISGIVTEAIGGTLSGWRVGVPGGSGRYGTGLGLSLGSWVQGVTGQPQAYYSQTPLLIEAEGGSFSGGRVRLAVHLFRMTLPRV